MVSQEGLSSMELVMGLMLETQTEHEHLLLKLQGKLHCQIPVIEFPRNICFDRCLKTPGEFCEGMQNVANRIEFQVVYL
jgi:hypothetical protein